MPTKLLQFFQGSLLAFLLLLAVRNVDAQSLGNAGTIQGTVIDPAGAIVTDAKVDVTNPLTGYKQEVMTDEQGKFRLVNLPRNTYHLAIEKSGFKSFAQDFNIKTALPVNIRASLALAATETKVDVESDAGHLVELDASAHVDADRSQFTKIPAFDPGGGLSQAIAYSTGGVAADSNGFFHPLGDHAQVSFVIDGQPISDQQSKVFSTQLPTSAIQSMEITTGAAAAEFGDKTSLVDQITTRSGLGSMRMFGSLDALYGNFGNAGGGASLGVGNEKFGNFIAIDGVRSGRFLDTPEFTAFHAKGNNQTIFDRLDYQPTSEDVFHLNLFVARNWIQIPNSYDQLAQDQRQRVQTWNIAPGYQHTFNSHYLLTVNPYIRKDQFIYYPSRDLLNDTPSTQSQSRQLMNYGIRSDIAINEGHHNIKLGIDLKQTRLAEQFAFGVTDAAFNPVCLSADDESPVIAPGITNPDACQAGGFLPNPGLQPGLVPYDLTRGGALFNYRSRGNINQYSAYVQDAITIGSFLLNVGLRGDTYYGLTADSAASPRVGLAYNVKKTGTVLRAAYSRTFETPFNEGLLLSSATGAGGLAQNVFDAASAPPLPIGKRNQFNAGFQQAIGRYLLIDADYFWKFTDNAYDFGTLQNTTLTFPISWRKSKLDGVTGRVSTTNLKGFQAYWTFGHTRARFFPGQTGGLVPQGGVGDTVFRIDHDQAFQSTMLARYQHKNAEWVSFTWRYDSGLVAGVADVDEALELTAAQQVSIGFACDGTRATFASPITSCGGIGTSRLLNLPQSGEGNDDHNPGRVKPRHLFNIGVGTDNLLHAESPRRIVARVEIQNLTNKEALYNFLSTFSGTHFVTPRQVTASVGYRF